MTQFYIDQWSINYDWYHGDNCKYTPGAHYKQGGLCHGRCAMRKVARPPVFTVYERGRDPIFGDHCHGDFSMPELFRVFPSPAIELGNSRFCGL